MKYVTLYGKNNHLRTLLCYICVHSIQYGVWDTGCPKKKAEQLIFSTLRAKNVGFADNQRNLKMTIFKNGHRIKIEPNLMILVSFSSVEAALSKDATKHNTFSSQDTENTPFRFLWDTWYSGLEAELHTIDLTSLLVTTITLQFCA